MAKPTKDNRKSVVDFGVGWVVIIYCLLMFFLYVGMCNDSANITAPNVAYRLGLEQGDIMNMNSWPVWWVSCSSSLPARSTGRSARA